MNCERDYVCRDCGQHFDEPEYNGESFLGECFGFPVYEKVYCCPYCGSDDYIEDRSYLYENEEETEQQN